MSFFDNLSDEAKESLRLGLRQLTELQDRHATELGERDRRQRAEREEIAELERLYNA